MTRGICDWIICERVNLLISPFSFLLTFCIAVRKVGFREVSGATTSNLLLIVKRAAELFGGFPLESNGGNEEVRMFGPRFPCRNEMSIPLPDTFPNPVEGC